MYIAEFSTVEAIFMAKPEGDVGYDWYRWVVR
jgi:hypothetical protein